MDGIIIVNKPQDWTSFDVVAKIRNLSGKKKVGHSGTLDPMATGVLPVFLGSATKSIKYFIGGNKGYLAEMTLGITTATHDAYGEVIKSQDVSCNVRDVEAVLNKYLGEIDQVPPMYSAVKINGERLYDLARKGVEVERESRKVTIYKIRLLNIENDKHPRITFEVYCSKGTYIRQLVADIGDELGCGAHLSKLSRIYAQPFLLSQAINMPTIITLAKIGKLDTITLPVEELLYGQQPGKKED